MRAALGDARWLAILGLTVLISVVLTQTALAGRAWMVLTWGVAVYAFAVSGSLVVSRSHVTSRVEPARELPQADALIRPTEEALRRLNKPGALADCALIGYLPLTLNELAALESGSPHQLLRAAIVQAIERLAPEDGTDEQSLHHAIVADEYIRGHSTARIMMRYSISESTFHRHRRDAIRAIARDLFARENAYAATGASSMARKRSM